MAYYSSMHKRFTRVGFLVGIAGVLFGLPGHIDDGLTWLRWRQALSPTALGIMFSIGVGILLVTSLAATASLWRPLVPGNRLRKLSRLLQEGKELDSAFTNATAARSPDDVDILMDFRALTKLIRLEIRRLYHVDIDTSLQFWSMIIRELAPLAREGMHKEVKQRCEELAANLSE
ncbi:MAG: hypothetical protein OYI31_09245 [Chloroflexota bacterium]|nr:hypothetical protein [Chloroflexota bacterium]MDE2941945.1 hypothetical protein [Chloroflexota bacterium]MDE3268618.1 hypothetical protein [Chloroflexota bacterium]